MINTLLNDSDLRVLNELTAELEHTFNAVQVHRTRTEMEASVLNDVKFPTPASKYWQALREQDVMSQGVTQLFFDYKEATVKIKIIERRMEEEKDELRRELLEIRRDRKVFAIKNIKRAASNKIREIKEWSTIKRREARAMTRSELSNVDNHQLISYTKRWINQVLRAGDSSSVSENNNLMGQLEKGVALCKEKGVLEQVLIDYPTDVQQRLLGGGHG